MKKKRRKPKSELKKGTSISIRQHTRDVVNSLRAKPANMRTFNSMVEFLIETHPDFIKEQTELNAK